MAKGLKPKFKGSYIRRFEEMLASPAYRDLSPACRCLIEEFQRIYRPGRNGYLSIPTRLASEHLNVSEQTAGNAFYEAREHGFIKLREEHSWQERKAREWTLTFEPFNGREPTNDWRMWEKDKPVWKNPKKNTDPKCEAELPIEIGQTALKMGLKRNQGLKYRADDIVSH
jgi:DNA-binding transcriptional MocR family regulator